MSNLLFEDATVEVAARLGQVAMSVREVLELQPGQVFSLATPVGGEVDVVCGDQVIARGRLVDVEGEVGVQVSAVYEPLSPRE